MSKTKALDNFVIRQFHQTGIDTLFFYYRRMRWRKAKACAPQYLGEGVPKRLMRWHLRRMRQAYILYGWEFDEYFMFNYNRLSRSGRKEFVTETQKDYFCDTIYKGHVVDLFTDKWSAYQHFAPYYKRDVCMLQSWEQDQDAVKRFLEKHNTFILKPENGSLGYGIQILHNTSADDVKALLKEYPGGFVMEELIDQAQEMAVLHPQSVNTVRITTLRLADRTHIIHPFVKVGRGDDIVDNAAQGGIFGVVDIDTGVVTSACDKMGNRYVRHPETWEKLIGFVIPQWDEALELAKELSTVVPEAAYTGWDLALTKDGWVVVEGNSRGQFVCYQMAEQKGFRKEFESMLGCTLKQFCKPQGRRVR